MSGLQSEKSIKFEIESSPGPSQKELSFEIQNDSQTDANWSWPIEQRSQALRQFDHESVIAKPSEVKIRHQHKDWSIFLTNAHVLVEHEEFDLALDILQEILKDDPDHAAALRLAFWARVGVGQSERAILIAKHLCRVEPTFDNFYLLADLFYQLNQDQDAEEFYLMAAQNVQTETPLLFEVYKNLGNIYVRKGDLDSAEECYNRAYTLHPDSDVLLVNYGTLEIQRENYEVALERFRQAVDRNPMNDRGWVGLGLIHRQYGDLDLAWANVERALDINLVNKTALHLEIEWAVKDGRVNTVLARIEEYLRKQPEDYAIRLIEAQLLILSGRFAPAKSILDELQSVEAHIEGLNELSETLRLEMEKKAEPTL